MKLLPSLIRWWVIFATAAFAIPACKTPSKASALSDHKTFLGATRSDLYSVKIAGPEGVQKDSFVFKVINPGVLPGGNVGPSKSASTEESTSWTSFPVPSPITVLVTTKKPFASARILPSHAGVAVTTHGNDVTFVITHPGQYALSLCPEASSCTDAADTDYINPLLIFADSPETDAPNPSAADVFVASPGSAVPPLPPGKKTLYFPAGDYYLGATAYSLQSGQSVYLASGAYVRGAFTGGQVNRVRIYGRGILSGETFKRDPSKPGPRLADSVQAGTPPLIYFPSAQSSDVGIDGITLIQAPFYNIQLGGTNNRVTNVKAIAWYPSTDGVQVGYDRKSAAGEVPGGGLIADSFFKVGDDAIKLNSSNLVVQRVTIWQLTNAAPFQIGCNTAPDVGNVMVEDSDVIRSEYRWASPNNAIFAARHGGAGHLHHEIFRNIRVENSTWQLFQLSINPTIWVTQGGQLGSIDDLQFQDVVVSNNQTIPDVFQGYNLQHAITNLSFRNVSVAGTAYGASPRETFNVNRSLSFTGGQSSTPLWRSVHQPTELQVWALDLPPFPTSSSPGQAAYRSILLSQPELSESLVVKGSGDFLGDGVASILLEDTGAKTLGIWRDPLQTTGSSWSTKYSIIYRLQPDDGEVVGIGDFTGAGYSDVLLWNSQSQSGKVLIIQAGQLVDQISGIKPPYPSPTWQVVGIGDADQNGYADIFLKDGPNGGIGLIYFGRGGVSDTVAWSQQNKTAYASSQYYTATYGADSGWYVGNDWRAVGALDIEGNGFAALLWVNQATGQFGVTKFSPTRPQSPHGVLVGKLPPGWDVQSIGDYNGDGAMDLLLRNEQTGGIQVWYLNWFSGKLFMPGPQLVPALGGQWSAQWLTR